MKNKQFLLATIIKIIFFILITLIIFLSLKIYKAYSNKKDNSKIYENLKSIMVLDTKDKEEESNISDTQPEKTEAITPFEKYIDLYNLNNDFIGWISIKDTIVQYPVMQTIDSPNFYLERNFEKLESQYGVPYVDEKCILDLSNNIVIYGHNMKDGSMFSTIIKYKDKEFYNNHKIINFDTLKDYGRYEVIAAFNIDIDKDTFYFNEYTNMNEADFKKYINIIKSKAFYDTTLGAEYGDKLITLCTCEYTYKNGRFVVVAKKIEGE